MAQKAGAAALGTGEQQVKRLSKRYREKGASGLVSMRWGKTKQQPIDGKNGIGCGGFAPQQINTREAGGEAWGEESPESGGIPDAGTEILFWGINTD